MGLFSSSKSKSKSIGATGGAQTQLGDATNQAFSGEKINANTNIVKVTNVTDLNAIANSFAFSDRTNSKAFAFSDRANERALSLGREALKANEKALDKALSVGEKSKARAHELAIREMEASSRFSDRILNAGLETVDILSERVNEQGSQFTEQVTRLTDSFQDFVTRENNPSERTSLYLIIGVAVVGIALATSNK